ncbi:hypothetical protein GGF31_005972 [Allomyces arbusculus]|nr:hypothetical protein GGF31_005972 [Allomyces arbusculus]
MAPYPILHLAARAVIAAAMAANASSTGFANSTSTATNGTASNSTAISTAVNSSAPAATANSTVVNGTVTTNHTLPSHVGDVFSGTSGQALDQVLLNKLRHPSPAIISGFAQIGLYFGIFLILWNLPRFGRMLNPIKLIVVAFHEFSHALVGKCTGAKIESIEVNPDEGGATRIRGGSACLVLPAGYIGSSVFGSLLVFCSFNPIACKVAASVVGLSLLATLWWARDNFTRALTIFWIAVLVLEWVARDGVWLSSFVIAVGTMSVAYSFWDMIEDLIRRRVNHSDAAIFAERYGGTPQFWGVFWFFISLLILAFAVIMAMLVWQ